ncbi:MAG: DUF433 domain-containing protein [Geminicoccaceae bacterium]
MSAETQPRIVSDPEKMIGKPIVRGTVVTVELLLAQLGDGLTVEEVAASHRGLAPSDVRAALKFAARAFRTAWNGEAQRLQPEGDAKRQRPRGATPPSG